MVEALFFQIIESSPLAAWALQKFLDSLLWSERDAVVQRTNFESAEL